jgi:non-specific serine/threonine protein kinase
VWLVDLAPLTDAALVPQAVASAAGIPEEARSPALAALRRALRQRRVLLVLDNCEHLVEACAALVEAVLGAGPHAQVLATSREVLRVAGETVWRVPMLAVPPPSAALPAEALARYESVRLFVERAGAAEPRFALTRTNAPTVAQLCRRLDGLPLALELAAARVPVLSVEEILARMEDQFRLLTGGSRTALPRQETLLAAVAWSHDLLTEAEQSMFARVAVFAGGWTLAAAEAVCADRTGEEPALPSRNAANESGPEGPTAGVGAEQPAGFRPATAVLRSDDVLDLLTRLAEKSMIVVDGDGGGPVRYRLHETLREFAARRLEAGARAEVFRERHLDYFAGLAEQAEPELEGPAQQPWLDRLEGEHDNCRAALQWALAHPTAATIELGLRLAGALTSFWLTRGHVREGRAWLERLLAAPAPAAPTAARVRALFWAGGAAGFLGAVPDRDVQRARQEATLAVARAAGDPKGLAWALHGLAFGAARRGEYGAATRWATEGLELLKRADDPNGVAWTLRWLGRLARDQGDYAAARRSFLESLALYRRTGNRQAEASVLHNLGQTLRASGDAAGSRPLHDEALAIWRELGYLNGVAGALNALGEVAHAEGNAALARSLYDESLAGYREVGASQALAGVLKNLAVLERAAGDPAAARAHLDEALAIWREIDANPMPASALEEFAAQAAARGQPERALRLAGAADGVRVALGRPLPVLLQARLDGQLAPARQALGAAAEAAWAAGRALALDQAIASTCPTASTGRRPRAGRCWASVPPRWRSRAGRRWASPCTASPSRRTGSTPTPSPTRGRSSTWTSCSGGPAGWPRCPTRASVLPSLPSEST